MENFNLKAKKRTVFGKQNILLRKQGFIPAVVYGRKTPACPLQIKAQDFNEVYKKAGDTNIVNLIIEDNGKEEKKNVLIHEIETHFLNNTPLHIDFYEVEMDKPIVAHIPINFIGESPAVKLGGILVKSMNEIEIEALPKNLPHEITVDLSSLTDFDQTIYVKDIDFPAEVRVLIEKNTPVVTVSAPLSEEELEKEIGEVKTIEEIAVEGEEKKKEEIEEKQKESVEKEDSENKAKE